MTATAVILMAVPECRHDDRLLRYSPVAAEIDGELYYSGEYVYPTIVNHDRSFIFRQEENGYEISSRVGEQLGPGQGLHFDGRLCGLYRETQ